VQLQEASARAAEKRAEVDQLSTSGIAEARAITEDAQTAATATRRDAEKTAKKLIADAQKQAKALIADAEDRLAKIRVEREAVAGYFENLRGLLAGADAFTAPVGFPVPGDEPEPLAAVEAPAEVIEASVPAAPDEPAASDAEAEEANTR
jgi:hypothetical protein